MKRIRVRDAILPVAILLIENSNLEHQVVQHQEQQAPFHKWHIQPLEALLAEKPRVLLVFLTKEIACCYEKQRHVKQVDEVDDKPVALGVTDAHQDNGYSFANRQISVSRHR